MGEWEYRKAVPPFLQAVEGAAAPVTADEPSAAFFVVVVVVVGAVAEIGLDLDLDLAPEVSTTMGRRASARVVAVAACAD